ncbi:SDR family NAD(P)-dependent oxidoreductase [Salinivirga cyanobacteriivorans]
MNYFYITGTSRGIGKAIAEKLLEDESNIVIGISRRQTINHERYRHVVFDLNMIEAVQAYEFEQYNDADKVVLINNSGVLGDVNHIGKMSSQKMVQSYNVNLIAPAILINSFMDAYAGTKAEKMIINISSGAARHVVNSWSTYCSTKAGLEMFAQVLDGEIAEAGRNDFRVFSIAPGIIDTEMQSEIRQVPDEQFSSKDKFVELKKNNQLTSPQEVAENMADVIANPDNYPETIMDFRD